ncbi:hypothetical protein [Streptomyces mirabilis]|uniref:hypothetical protein n=1 Tax=Streptomyces mirabilis TaxID=68239 RepID=UPI0033E747DD
MLVTAKLRRRTKAAARTAPKALGYRTLSGLIAAAVEQGRLILISGFLNRIGGADLPDGKMSWLGRHCANAYRATHGTSPIRVWAQHRTTGKWNHVYAYGPIDEALYEGLRSYKGTRHLLTTEAA